MARRQPRRNRNQREEIKFRINDLIRVPEVRLVGDNLEAVSEAAGKEIVTNVYTTKQVKKWADAMDLDLVEISPKAKPPVVKIIDYKIFVYDQKKRQKDIKSKAVKAVVKEIRFDPTKDDHDFAFKTKHAQRFLEEGAKVKAYVQFRGRTIVLKERGELLLLRFLKQLEDFGAAEALPRMEGRRMTVIVQPKKRK